MGIFDPSFGNDLKSNSISSNICMPHLYKKTFRGRTYWYLREVHRVGGKVRVKWQKYLGTPETILAKIEQSEGPEKPVRLRTEMFGALFVAHLLEKELPNFDSR